MTDDETEDGKTREKTMQVPHSVMEAFEQIWGVALRHTRQMNDADADVVLKGSPVVTQWYAQKARR